MFPWKLNTWQYVPFHHHRFKAHIFNKWLFQCCIHNNLLFDFKQIFQVVHIFMYCTCNMCNNKYFLLCNQILYTYIVCDNGNLTYIIQRNVGFYLICYLSGRQCTMLTWLKSPKHSLLLTWSLQNMCFKHFISVFITYLFCITCIDMLRWVECPSKVSWTLEPVALVLMNHKYKSQI